MIKQCCECKKILPLDSFYKNKSNKGGLHYACKRCHANRGCKIIKKLRETNPSKIHEREGRYRHVNPHRTWARNTISAHKNRGFLVHLNTDELEVLARKNTVCNICGSPLGWGKNTKVSADSPTLDRVNNEQELTFDNIQITCHRCNTLKGTWRMERFINYCHVVSSRFQ